MGNRWHETQENNMQPDIKAQPCPWCDADSVVVDTVKFDHEHLSTWTARASCHECGAQSPDSDFPSWPDHSLHNEYLFVDSENEREVVNFAVKVWNTRS